MELVEPVEPKVVSTHSRLKAAGFSSHLSQLLAMVSTHSRLKAAVFQIIRFNRRYICFNTQPPEGG